MGYVLTVWASPAQAVIVFAILAGVGFGLYKWAKHEPQKRRTPKSTSASPATLNALNRRVAAGFGSKGIRLTTAVGLAGSFRLGGTTPKAQPLSSGTTLHKGKHTKGKCRSSPRSVDG